jgi:hypothetical protein
MGNDNLPDEMVHKGIDIFRTPVLIDTGISPYLPNAADCGAGDRTVGNAKLLPYDCGKALILKKKTRITRKLFFIKDLF